MKDATDPLTFEIRQEDIDDALAAGVKGRDMVALAIKRSLARQGRNVSVTVSRDGRDVTIEEHD